MDIKIKLTSGRIFELIKFGFKEFNEQAKEEVNKNLQKLAIKIFNIINIFGPKVIALECEDKALKSYLIKSLNLILQKKFTFEKLGGGIQILSSLPFSREEENFLKSKIKHLGTFGNQVGIGVDIGGHSIKAVCIDGNGKIIKRLEADTRKKEGYRVVIQQIITLIKNLLEYVKDKKVISIGIGIPGGIGPIFVRKMIIMEDWKDVNLRTEIEDAVRIPTFVENDANVMALGEKEISKIQGNCIALTLGTGVGGGIIINDKILHGENYFAGELGHIIIDDSENARLCGCGNKGCLEAYSSGTAIAKIAQEEIPKHETIIPNLVNNDLSKISARIVAMAAHQGDKLAIDIYHKAAENLAKGIKIISDATGISQVLIGGKVAKVGDFFYEEIRKNLKTKYVPVNAPIKVYESCFRGIRGDLRGYTGAIGAAILGMEGIEEVAEKVAIIIKEDDAAMGKMAAQIIAEQIRKKPDTVLGLATGSTPISMYKELVRMHKEEKLDFSQVITFNLDEYYPMKKDHPQSYHSFMKYWLFDHINIKPENIHIPNGELPEEEIESFCLNYEELIKKVGGIDIQVLGIGGGYFDADRNLIGGHIGFNEAGSDFNSRTRKMELTEKTRIDNARFFKYVEEVPHFAITMGIGTILDAKKIILLASGEHKAPIIKEAVEGRVNPFIPASILQTHPNVHFILEKGAASRLSRIMYPWIFFDVDWAVEQEKAKTGENHIDNALIWLSVKLNKPLADLEIQDFEDNFLSDLINYYNNNATKLSNEVIKRTNQKILYRENLPRNKKILIISPHPDDDVICLGNTIKVLNEIGNIVKIIYVVSGNIAVRESDVIEYCKLNKLSSDLQVQIQEKTIDYKELLKLKTAVRKSEAIAAEAILGISADNLIFLNSPFYETGTIVKSIISDADITPLVKILNYEMPDIVFVPGEVADPHGTHGKASEIFKKALKNSKVTNAELWHFKSAWEEYAIHEANKIIPFDSKSMELKIKSIKAHKSQLIPLFPGMDPRPFWQRAKDRNKHIGNILKILGIIQKNYDYAEVCKSL
ncbi:MAG: glucosamine-6-phosphate deaminase [Candidatus Helarchaeota archaeon]